MDTTAPYTLMVDQYAAGLVLALRTVRAWFGDDRAIEDSPSKLIYIGLGLAVVAAVGLIVWNVLNAAEEKIPDPIVPANPNG